uniref:Uncharacterized protein n=1 Tax=Romanomermis culicivorax TaxID=13658 RepID=A0A915LBH0_ROMCU
MLTTIEEHILAQLPMVDRDVFTIWLAKAFKHFLTFSIYISRARYLCALKATGQRIQLIISNVR